MDRKETVTTLVTIFLFIVYAYAICMANIFIDRVQIIVEDNTVYQEWNMPNGRSNEEENKKEMRKCGSVASSIRLLRKWNLKSGTAAAINKLK